MALYEKMLDLVRDPSLINKAVTSMLTNIVLITALDRLHLSEYRINTKGFRTSGLLFLQSRSCHNKSAFGALKQNHSMIQEAKSSRRNLIILLLTPSLLHTLRF